MTTHSEPTDGEVVCAVLQGDADQFAHVVRRYQFALLRVAKSRLGRADWAEEAVQETFLCALKSLHTYDSRYNFRTWLWTILLNQCHRAYRRRQRRVGAISLSERTARNDASEGCVFSDRLQDASVSPLDQAAEKERSALLEQTLRQLPVVQADALRLRFHGGLKFREIADAMDCSLSSAKNRVKSGLLGMSELLAASDVDPSEVFS